MNDQFSYNAYGDYGLTDYHPHNQDNFYQNDYRMGEQEYHTNMANAAWLYQNSGVNQPEPRWQTSDASIEVTTDAPSNAYELNYWEDDRNQVGDRVRVNQGALTWATGEGIPSWVHGRVYPVIETRIRNNATELLLGAGINSWIRLTDITVVTETTPTPPPTTTIRLNDRVKVKQGVRTWATGEGMPSWVHGRIYPVIEIRTRHGITELLLGAGINSWIRETDVKKSAEAIPTPPPPATTIRVNDRVKVNQGVRTWATGEGMPSWVHGRTYQVIETRTRAGHKELLLGDILSWIRKSDVTKV